MKFLVDVCAGIAVAAALRRLGHDVAEVRDRDPRLDDMDILDWAVQEQRLVVTMDRDFGALVFESLQPHAGVLLLRLRLPELKKRCVLWRRCFSSRPTSSPIDSTSTRMVAYEVADAAQGLDLGPPRHSYPRSASRCWMTASSSGV
jgi:predicted nuclease of predicted toxin-antitoxin system